MYAEMNKTVLKTTYIEEDHIKYHQKYQRQNQHFQRFDRNSQLSFVLHYKNYVSLVILD